MSKHIIFGVPLAEWELATLGVIVSMSTILVLTFCTQAWMELWDLRASPAPRPASPVLVVEEASLRAIEPPTPSSMPPPTADRDGSVMVLREVGGRRGGVWFAIVNGIALLALPFLGLSIAGGMLWIIVNQILLATIVLVRHRRTFVVHEVRKG